MSQSPRIAVGIVQDTADARPLIWGLTSLLQRAGMHVQSFLAQARFPAWNGALPITGQTHRHLDSWLMSARVCRLLMGSASRLCDLALVEGRFDSAFPGGSPDGGSLNTLCAWLQLPPIAIVDVSRIDACRLPTLPAGTAGLLVDRVPDTDSFCRWKTALEALSGVPVLGAFPTAPALRSVVQSLEPGTNPSHQLCRALGDQLACQCDLERIVHLAQSRPLPEVDESNWPVAPCHTGAHIAVAYDDAFHCYFPDTLDLLEATGARLSVFSPLKQESLPPATDVVYLGCGNAARYGEQLSNNCCLRHALRAHVANGGRIYAECAGLAYLCEDLVLDDSRHYRMLGILPAIAHYHANSAVGPKPVELTTANDCWLFGEGKRLRGYLNPHWVVKTRGQLPNLLADPTHSHDVIGFDNVVGSRLHINFAAQPSFLRSFGHGNA